MINILLNNENFSVPENISIAEMLQHCGNKNEVFAVAMNGVVIPRGKHAETVIKNNDRFDLIAPMCGG